MNVLIAGDFCDRYRISDLIARGNYASLFDDIKYLTEQADVSIINFEFPIVLHAGVPITKSGPTLQGQPAAVDAVKYAGFNVCTLANNHILDQGTKCCIETRELLENAGIKTVGIGKNSAEAATVLYINQKEKGTLAIVNCCEHEFSIATATTAGANPLNPIQQYYNIQEARTKADYVLVIVHGGHEHYALPSPRMKETYRFFIDAGADAIINHHQHCYSGYEIYHGKPIFYGLGNLLFDHKSERHGPWNEGFMVSLRLDKQTLPQFELYPYTQCNERPSVIPMNEAERIGEKYIIPTLGVWTKAEEVDFDTLPDKFVIKCNHNSGTGMYICKDKQQMDVQKVRNGLRTGLQEDYFHHNGEWPYKNIKPRIIAEQYIEDKKSHELYDYKFFCFNGKVKLFKIDFDRFTEHHANYYTPTGEILPLVETAYPPQFDRIISMPSTLPQMISLAETLSCGIPFLRVDFYTIGMDIFFGELTFFPTSGMTPFEPKDWDKKLGDMLILPTKNK